MNIEQQLKEGIAQAFSTDFSIEITPESLTLQPTKKEFEGTHTFVTFPYGRQTKKKPEETAQTLGKRLKAELSIVKDFNVVKGFLNLTLTDRVWIETLASVAEDDDYGRLPATGVKAMVEYSSPNTNKPLHLGHLRNNFLGHAVSNILEAAGQEVLKANLVNDRGIHICKSMLAYQLFGNGEAPSELYKGDKLVGDYYVKFDKEYKAEIEKLIEEYTSERPEEDIKKSKAEAEKNAPLMLAAQEMLRKWEAGDEETVELWKKMNGWVLDGHEQTYRLMGVEFDKFYYESDTYLLGKDIVSEGLEKGVFYKKEDGSVWVDLEAEKLDHKLVLRSDGTSVYMTQDLGTADLKYEDFPMQQSVYVVGNEQEYHFKVLKIILQKMGRAYADGIYHLSYGMVDLPTGKMKSREGTVVDADDLINEMIVTARERTTEVGKIDDFTPEEADKLYRMLALGALKFYLLRVEPKKRMLFNPEESIDFQGDTGVYIQYNHAISCSALRRAEASGIEFEPSAYSDLQKLNEDEIAVIQALARYPEKLAEAARNYAPSDIATYAMELSRTYSRFYAKHPILRADTEELRAFRLSLTEQVVRLLRISMELLGIELPEKM